MLLFCIDECESHTHICVCDYCNAIEKCPAPFHEQTEILPELKLNKNIIYKLDTKEKTHTMRSKIEITNFYSVFYTIFNKESSTCYLCEKIQKLIMEHVILLLIKIALHKAKDMI